MMECVAVNVKHGGCKLFLPNPLTYPCKAFTLYLIEHQPPAGRWERKMATTPKSKTTKKTQAKKLAKVASPVVEAAVVPVVVTIKNRFTGAVLFTSNTAIDLARAVKEAVASRAYLSGADLSGADLSRAKDAELVIARTRILPEGSLIGWKKLSGGTIAKLHIPEEARRSHAFGRKCRAEYADVIEGEGLSSHDGVTKYAPGLRVTADKWCEDWKQECAGGIHFFLTRLEAEAY